jgi:hypothetical protein
MKADHRFVLMLASSRPIFECGKAAASADMTDGSNERIGILWSGLSSGTITALARWWVEAMYP